MKGFTHARLACGCRIAFRDGVEVSMSKRAGDFITLDELLAEREKISLKSVSGRTFFAS